MAHCRLVARGSGLVGWQRQRAAVLLSNKRRGHTQHTEVDHRSSKTIPAHTLFSPSMLMTARCRSGSVSPLNSLPTFAAYASAPPAAASPSAVVLV